MIFLLVSIEILIILTKSLTMKYIYFLFNLVLCYVASAQCPNTFSLSTSTGSFVLGCNPSSLTVNAVSTATTSGMTYTWTGPMTYSVGSSVNLSIPGNYFVQASSASNTCIIGSYFTIYSNPAIGTFTAMPISVIQNCGSVSSFTTVWSNTTTTVFQVFQQNGFPLTAPSIHTTFTNNITSFSVGAPGYYTAVLTNSLNGCITAFQFTNSPASGAVPNVEISSSPSASIACAGGPLTLSINASTTIAPVSYTITNLTTSSSVTSTSNTMSITTPGLYKVDRNDGNSCNQFSYIYISNASNLPVINISGTNSVCLGTSANLSVSVTGATNYTWSTGATTNTVNVIPASNTNYSVTAVNGICSSTSLIAVSVNTTCADVWPGDANSDGVVSTLDILEIGTHFGNSGSGRSVVSNSWTPYFANVWTGTLSTGKNECHSDCNGDGFINNSDTVAVKSNFSLTHSFKSENQNALSADVMITPDQPVIGLGMWGTASVYLGSSSSPISNIYGLAFDVSYDNSLLETDSCYLSFTNSFLNASGANIQFQKNQFSGGVNYIASVRTDLNNVNGFGKIATLHYKAKSTLTSDAALNVGVSNAQMISTTGMPVTLSSSGTSSLTISTTFVGINESGYANSSVYLYPQPACNSFLIHMGKVNTTEVNIVITDVLGKTVVNAISKVENEKVLVSAADLNSGTYIVKITSREGVSINKKLVISK